MEVGDMYEYLFVNDTTTANELFRCLDDQADQTFYYDQNLSFVDFISDLPLPTTNEDMTISNSSNDQVVNDQGSELNETSPDMTYTYSDCWSPVVVAPSNNMHPDFHICSPELSPSNTKCHISQKNLLELKAKDLNKLLKNLPEEEVKALKRKRRQLKNRTYAKDCRKKKVHRSLSQEDEIAQLKMELKAKSQEVEKLKEENRRLKAFYNPNI